MDATIPDRLTSFMETRGVLETQKAGQVFHSQDFAETMFMLKSGYVKRYEVSKDDKRVIELIYGPSHVFPLSQLYRKLFGVEINREELVYVYQAMTDLEIYRIEDDAIEKELKSKPQLFIDLFYESGLRLKSNIYRLASNALDDDYKKVAHQLVSLADEFGELATYKNQQVTKILVPLQPIDVAEQVNISVEIADAVLASLSRNKLILMDGAIIMIPDIAKLTSAYL